MVSRRTLLRHSRALGLDKFLSVGRGMGDAARLPSSVVANVFEAVVAAMPEVPFLCAYRRATEITDKHPYCEISHYLRCHRDKVDRVFETLSYFDGVNFAARATARALFTAGLMDEVCPPSTVYAAYNYWAGEKDILVYDYMQHESGSFQKIEQIRFLKELWG